MHYASEGQPSWTVVLDDRLSGDACYNLAAEPIKWSQTSPSPRIGAWAAHASHPYNPPVLAINQLDQRTEAMVEKNPLLWSSRPSSSTGIAATQRTIAPLSTFLGSASVCLLFWAAVGTAESSGPSLLIPETIYFTEYQPSPIFYGSTLLIEDSRGNVELAQAEEAVATVAAKYFEMAPSSGACAEIDTSVNPRSKLPPGHRTLEAVVAANDVAVRGRVLELRAGFSWNEPGTVVAVDLTEAVAGSWPLDDPLLFFVPKGKLVSRTRCLEILNTDWASLPVPGDEVILIFENTWYNQHSPLTLIKGSGFLRFSATEASFPAGMRDQSDLGTTSSAVSARIASTFAERQRRNRS